MAKLFSKDTEKLFACEERNFESTQERRGQEYGFSDSRDRRLPHESTASDRYVLTNRDDNGAAMTGRSILARGPTVPHFAL
jgi:hypothetical protein